jgi:CDP-diacylglycerol--serine O-phosphatidyltransferase
MKRIAIIPTLLTLGNAVCGFAAVAYASKIRFTPETEVYFAVSGFLIIAAMIFDALDGYAARLTKAVSKFGAELDSLCDAVSFGLAPAFLLLQMGPGWDRYPSPLARQFLAAVAGLYLLCALLRLARFNVETPNDPASGRRFRGLPSPAAAGCIATLALLRGELASDRWGYVDPPVRLFAQLGVTADHLEAVATLGAFVVALLMVSRLPFPHLTKQVLRGRKSFRHVVQFVFLLFVVVVFPVLVLLIGFWGYALGMPIRAVVLRWLKPEESPLVSTTPLDDVLPR